MKSETIYAVTNREYEYIINVSRVPFLKVLRIVLEAY